MYPAKLWKPLSDSRVRCDLCNHFCLIEDGERGQCGVRVNKNGELYTLVYDRVAAANLDPVEKKPLYHFHPGTLTFSFGTQGCNYACAFCQNESLSQPPRNGRTPQGQQVTPQALVNAALESGAHSISYTYSEPTIFFELMLDTARLAHQNGLKNIMVSNGFQSRHCLAALAPFIDAANIDLKSFSDDFYRKYLGARHAPVLETLRTIKSMGWWLEVTTLVIPGLNDSQKELSKIASFIATDLDKETPWHLSRFRPQFKMMDRPATPVGTLEMGYALGRAAGLAHVYLGNVPGNRYANTICGNCGQPLVSRMGFASESPGLASGKCTNCGHDIAGSWS